jgi:hypothetical protein
VGHHNLAIQIEEPQYFSPKNFPLQQRKRTDSNGYFHSKYLTSSCKKNLESHAHLIASNGGNSTNTHMPLVFGEQPPFYH